MKKHCTGFAKVFLVLLMLAEMACSTKPIRLSRRGLLEDQEGRSSSCSGQTLPFRKTASEMYSPKAAEVSLSGNWQWSLDSVEISSPYGERGRKFHQGVDLRAKVGTKVHAAAPGEVVYVGSKIRGYGRMVVLKHPGGFYTVYAHHSKNLVKSGQKVERGEVIALSGKSG